MRLAWLGIIYVILGLIPNTVLRLSSTIAYVVLRFRL